MFPLDYIVNVLIWRLVVILKKGVDLAVRRTIILLDDFMTFSGDLPAGSSVG